MLMVLLFKRFSESIEPSSPLPPFQHPHLCRHMLKICMEILGLGRKPSFSNFMLWSFAAFHLEKAFPGHLRHITEAPVSSNKKMATVAAPEMGTVTTPIPILGLKLPRCLSYTTLSATAILSALCVHNLRCKPVVNWHCLLILRSLYANCDLKNMHAVLHKN